MQEKQLISHAEVERVLKKAGYSNERIAAVLRQLPDPVDTDRDGEALFKLGLSRGSLMERMGGSP